MRVVLAYVFLVGLVLLFAAAGYGLWACADTTAHAVWYCRLLESIKPFTELISVILAFSGFLFGTIFSKNFAHEKETRATARAFAAEIGSIATVMDSLLKTSFPPIMSQDEFPGAEAKLDLSIHKMPIYGHSAQSLGNLPVKLASQINWFYWFVIGQDALWKEAKVEPFQRFEEPVSYLHRRAIKLEGALLEIANTPLPPWWKLMWLR